MIEVLRTNDPVKLNFAETILRDAGIKAVTLDAETAGVFGGSLPWIKRRLLVGEGDIDQAKRLLRELLPESEQR